MAPQTAIAEETREKTALAPRWKVIVHNDPITTFEFVESVLQSVFAKSAGAAKRIARETHETGSALVAILPREQAEFRIEQVRSLARAQGFPLALTMEPAD